MKKKLLSGAMLFTLMFTPQIVHGMHIMEGFLPPKWAIIWGVLSLPFLVIGFKNLNTRLRKGQDQKMLLGLVGGFVLSAVKFMSVFALTQIPLAIVEGIITVMVFNLISQYKKEGVLDVEGVI